MKKYISLLIVATILIVACNHPTTNSNEISVRDRISSAVIYEVNIRQYTPEGTFSAFTSKHLERLSKLGMDILWLMPVNPISEKNRKGSLGSYYAVADYKKVNPEMGSLDDLKNLVNKAHELGMYVILDWVANHTGWDNPWITEHPDWYTHDSTGSIISPVPDWSDVADLNYDNDTMRIAMIDAMKYWIKEVNIDGYRCDAAAMVPVDFWVSARESIDSIKPVFMLAEAWEPELLVKAFDAGYAWELHHMMNRIAKSESSAASLDHYLTWYDSLYTKDDILMNFITNHDENTWAGSEYERMGIAVNTFAVLTYFMPGMPLIYSGQEAGLTKRLRFFEKDTINQSDTALYSFYRNLNHIKHTNPALAAGIFSGKLTPIQTGNKNIFAFVREKDNNRILAIFNLSDSTETANLNPESDSSIGYTDMFSGQSYNIGSELKLTPWKYICCLLTDSISAK